MAVSEIAEVNGTKLFYEVAGEGFPLILLHDGLLDSRTWDAQFQLFAQHFKVLRYDARGYGQSELPHTKFSEVQDLAALLQFLKINRAYFVGLSNGGKIALEFALEHPAIVAKLVAAGPSLSGYKVSDEKRQRLSAIWSMAAEKGVSGVVDGWLNDPFWAPAADKAALRQHIETLLTEKLNFFLATPNFRLSLEPPATQRLTEIKVPTLLLIGERDDPDNHAIVDILAQGINGAQKVVIAGAGHMVNMEQPDEFNRLVLNFLKN